ncbi:hypothetical protein A2334_00895 [Candidatus Roizmanbacteria bacterium RIFOXYB2_FULL_38_10]|uniref:GH18 domain-containing protein n=1 Tax=Candidatus Roizmanbacteria bacterium RIFOXYD1_FULL_38_12 TaxID=1802093 RepID=A0A1F7L1D7_9BACT|nr:MAG: hypothetical protein A3K47_04190 [Candidatus Roizmanbacteria bacterium RIFOXYA2_FULL_38_14]OGK63957.1 MAG: hypothetical protein A3K27_04190 [Candidatus Roizmanbacteria bacterium RIFOXYA1_FULL_37_12]OGK65803.1 MAG: hypothetical protein A3K38_04190 [Candidatus Roizmanbacteria bacterium RIFOXYB1_FULL_40_23]OGK68911.1 MAG: hypothetical protein A2334_00895 [Candidatus Roizmanbacteria bacterium RIFOXYB2_FULL_38_10]OGK70208.1 MAG: hypothetical protein A3K21_04195 [Candidatus Roizmanbacteria ba
MKKALVFMILIFITAVYLVGKIKHTKTVSQEKNSILRKTEPTKKTAQSILKQKTSIFVPYWAIGQDEISTIPFDTIYYFGIAVHKKGIDENEAGYQNLERMICPNDKKCILVLRMLDAGVNKVILEDNVLQKQIMRDSMELVETYSFSGIALDLEQVNLFDTDLTKRINIFVQSYYTELHKANKTLSTIVYGDAYYRKRPFDIKSMGGSSDEVMIMAYDFHKNYSEPGPNFPFDRKSLTSTDYGYDFKQMIKDFTASVPSERITVIFGMYGYDWTLNNQGTPLKRGEAVTVNQIKKLTNSAIQIINKSQIPNSKEKKIEYEDGEGQKHVIWYEDEESVAVKINYLKEQGIGSVSYWAYGYF